MGSIENRPSPTYCARYFIADCIRKAIKSRAIIIIILSWNEKFSTEKKNNGQSWIVNSSYGNQ